MYCELYRCKGRVINGRIYMYIGSHLISEKLFISRMPKMCAILQLVSAPLNPIPIAEHFRRSHPQ